MSVKPSMMRQYTARNTLRSQLDEAEETLRGFEGVDEKTVRQVDRATSPQKWEHRKKNMKIRLHR